MPNPARVAARSRAVSQYVTRGSRSAGRAEHPASALAGDRRVVHGDLAPRRHRVAHRRPVVAEGERHQPGLARRPAEREVGGELLDLVHGHVVDDVDSSSKRAASLTVGCTARPLPTSPRKPERCSSAGVLDRAGADDDVVEVDRARRALGAGELSPECAASIADRGESTRCSTSIRAPAARARGRNVRVMLWRSPAVASRPCGYVIQRGISSCFHPSVSAPSRSLVLAAE